MVYLAVVLIGLGFVFLGLYVYLLRLERPVEPEMEAPKERGLPLGEEHPSSLPSPGSEREMPPKAGASGIALEGSRKPKAPKMDFGKSADDLQRRLAPRQGRAPKKKRKKKKALEIDGILFLDHSRKLLSHSSLPSEGGGYPESFFDTLKRMGQGRLRATKDAFEIECGDARWNYKTGKLDQILFQESGLAFVTIDESQAIALFLSNGSKRVREFVKKHAT